MATWRGPQTLGTSRQRRTQMIESQVFVFDVSSPAPVRQVLKLPAGRRMRALDWLPFRQQAHRRCLGATSGHHPVRPGLIAGWRRALASDWRPAAHPLDTPDRTEHRVQREPFGVRRIGKERRMLQHAPVHQPVTKQIGVKSVPSSASLSAMAARRVAGPGIVNTIDRPVPDQGIVGSTQRSARSVRDHTVRRGTGWLPTTPLGLNVAVTFLSE